MEKKLEFTESAKKTRLKKSLKMTEKNILELLFMVEVALVLNIILALMIKLKKMISCSIKQ